MQMHLNFALQIRQMSIQLVSRDSFAANELLNPGRVARDLFLNFGCPALEERQGQGTKSKSKAGTSRRWNNLLSSAPSGNKRREISTVPDPSESFRL
jgi:hypothetical protein